MAIEQKWDVKRDNKIFSLLSFGQVTRLIAKGLLKEDDLIWHSGLSGWRKAGEVEELKPFFQKLKKKLKKTSQEDEKQIKILIVDDNKDLRETLCEFLRDKGYNAISAQDGYEAIEKVKEGGVAIIFMDVKLPKMNGVETYKAIKKIDPTIVTVMMTGYSVPDLLQEAMKEGAYDCLHKPFTVDEMLNMIKKIVTAQP